MKLFSQKLRPQTPCQDSVKNRFQNAYNLKTKTFQTVKMRANCSEHFKIVIYEVSSLKISSQNLRENVRALLHRGSTWKSCKGRLLFSKIIQSSRYPISRLLNRLEVIILINSFWFLEYTTWKIEKIGQISICNCI